MFPPSLRGYVERALARCKGEMQMAACQTVLKEVSYLVKKAILLKNYLLFNAISYMFIAGSLFL